MNLDGFGIIKGGNWTNFIGPWEKGGGKEKTFGTEFSIKLTTEALTYY